MPIPNRQLKPTTYCIFLKSEETPHTHFTQVWFLKCKFYNPGAKTPTSPSSSCTWWHPTIAAGIAGLARRMLWSVLTIARATCSPGPLPAFARRATGPTSGQMGAAALVLRPLPRVFREASEAGCARGTTPDAGRLAPLPRGTAEARVRPSLVGGWHPGGSGLRRGSGWPCGALGPARNFFAACKLASSTLGGRSLAVVLVYGEITTIIRFTIPNCPTV